MALNWLFFFKAIKTTSLANAVISYYTAPIFVAIFANILLKEKFEKRKLLPFATAFFGLAFMVVSFNNPISVKDIYGISFGLIAAVFYSLVTIIGKKLSHIPAFLLVFCQTGFASIIFFFVTYNSPFVKSFFRFSFFQNTYLSDIIILSVIAIIHIAGALGLYFSRN